MSTMMQDLDHTRWYSADSEVPDGCTTCPGLRMVHLPTCKISCHDVVCEEAIKRSSAMFILIQSHIYLKKFFESGSWVFCRHVLSWVGVWSLKDDPRRKTHWNHSLCIWGLMFFTISTISQVSGIPLPPRRLYLYLFQLKHKPFKEHACRTTELRHSDIKKQIMCNFVQCFCKKKNKKKN